jgi:hypothetical protein
MAEAYFSPYDDCEAAIVSLLSYASSYVIGAMNMYQSDPIHKAILAAHARTSITYLIFDRRQQFLADPRLQELQDAGVVVMLDKHERSIRSQYLIQDDAYVMTGSYLYTYPYKLKYASDLTWIQDPFTLGQYYNDWLYHYNHSVLF